MQPILSKDSAKNRFSEEKENKLFLIIFHKIKRPADLSIVERLGGFLWCKGKTFIWIVQGFWKKSVEMKVIFNRCWVFRDANSDNLINVEKP